MSLEDGPTRHAGPETLEEARRRIEKLERINEALMDRVERALDHDTSAFSLFQTAIALEAEVRNRTEELNAALTRLERSNADLLLARDAAERANRSKTGFFTALGHDLLQPIHAARLTLTALAETPDPARAKVLTGHIDHAMATIEDLLKTLLDLSRLDAGVVKPAVQPVRLADLFAGLALDIEPSARAKGLHLYFRPTTLTVRSDAMMLRRICQNLVGNAVRYTHAGGIRVVAWQVGDLVRIAVCDTGPGITPEDQVRIFDEFQRGATAERDSPPGLGLGLSIVRRMADALGHDLTLRSRVGRGSIFALTAPVCEAVEPPPVEVAPQRALYGLSEARVLVVENDDAVATAMLTLLQRWGCEARLARDSKDLATILPAAENAGGWCPDIVLADYHLDAGETGLELVCRLRRTRAPHLPAVVITADPDTRLAEAVRAAGCEYLRKPVRPAELRALMAHLLG